MLTLFVKDDGLSINIVNKLPGGERLFFKKCSPDIDSGLWFADNLANKAPISGEDAMNCELQKDGPGSFTYAVGENPGSKEWLTVSWEGSKSATFEPSHGLNIECDKYYIPERSSLFFVVYKGTKPDRWAPEGLGLTHVEV
ncbi:hypothetical protein Dda_6883 [Drechslerella dactyloides]|uniref:Uncharacterized protein n=1 Tax=Drechslerella dactyloides TaxID=74499 RepID=A0AAD6IVP9_DREDA|nr:hypothetical protein Dda_6883 [Drechslerella dactyloides]